MSSRPTGAGAFRPRTKMAPANSTRQRCPRLCYTARPACGAAMPGTAPGAARWQRHWGRAGDARAPPPKRPGATAQGDDEDQAADNSIRAVKCHAFALVPHAALRVFSVVVFNAPLRRILFAIVRQAAEGCDDASFQSFRIYDSQFAPRPLAHDTMTLSYRPGVWQKQSAT